MQDCWKSKLRRIFASTILEAQPQLSVVQSLREISSLIKDAPVSILVQFPSIKGSGQHQLGCADQATTLAQVISKYNRSYLSSLSPNATTSYGFSDHLTLHFCAGCRLQRLPRFLISCCRYLPRCTLVLRSDGHDRREDDMWGQAICQQVLHRPALHRCCKYIISLKAKIQCPPLLSSYPCVLGFVKTTYRGCRKVMHVR